MLRILLVLLCLITLGCNPLPEEKRPLKVGFNPWPGYEFLYLADIKNFYAAQGVEVKLVELGSAGDVRRAFERGHIDIMASTLVELAIAAETLNQRPKIIAVMDTSFGADAIYAKKNIQRIEDLKGKTVGMDGATVDVLVVAEALRHHQMTMADIQPVYGPQDDLIHDMLDGNLDAVKTYPPHSVALLKSGKFHKIFDTTEIPDVIVDFISVSESAYTQRLPEIKKFLQALYQAFDYAQAHPEVSVGLMAEREQISHEDYLAVSQGINFKGRAQQREFLEAQSTRDNFQYAIDSLVASKWLDAPMDANDFFDPDLFKQ